MTDAESKPLSVLSYEWFPVSMRAVAVRWSEPAEKSTQGQREVRACQGCLMSVHYGGPDLLRANCTQVPPAHRSGDRRQRGDSSGRQC